MRVCKPCARPIIVRCSPVPTTGAITSITGFNLTSVHDKKTVLASPAGDKRHSGDMTVYIDGVECADAVLQVVEESCIGATLLCLVPPGQGADKEVIVEVDGLRGDLKHTHSTTKLIQFYYTHISPSHN